MRAVVLVGGFGTRIENIAKGRAKTLLPICYDGKYQPIFYFLLDKLKNINAESKILDEIIVLTNDKYYDQMADACEKYEQNQNLGIKLSIISDHSTCNDNRLGANGDLQFVNPFLTDAQDVLVLAGDNYFDFELEDVVKFYNNKKQQVENPTIIVAKNFPQESREYVHKSFAVIDVDNNGKVIKMAEKPLLSGIQMKSNMGVIALYVMPRQNFNLIDEYLSSCNNPKGRDALGHFVSFLAQNTPTYPFVFTGEFIDIGTEAEYLKLQKSKEM